MDAERRAGGWTDGSGVRIARNVSSRTDDVFFRTVQFSCAEHCRRAERAYRRVGRGGRIRKEERAVVVRVGITGSEGPARHGWSVFSVLVSGWHVHRIFCERQAEEVEPGRRTSADALRGAVGTRRNMEQGWSDPVHTVRAAGRGPEPRIRGRGNADADHYIGYETQRNESSLAGIPARW